MAPDALIDKQIGYQTGKMAIMIQDFNELRTNRLLFFLRTPSP
jgi:hypothetical protein